VLFSNKLVLEQHPATPPFGRFDAMLLAYCQHMLLLLLSVWLYE
jgi:hypothetical protein